MSGLYVRHKTVKGSTTAMIPLNKGWNMTISGIRKIDAAAIYFDTGKEQFYFRGPYNSIVRLYEILQDSTAEAVVCEKVIFIDIHDINPAFDMYYGKEEAHRRKKAWDSIVNGDGDD